MNKKHPKKDRTLEKKIIGALILATIALAMIVLSGTPFGVLLGL